MQCAMLAVRDGSILMDYVEMTWETVLSLQPKLPPLNRLNAHSRHSTEMRVEGMTGIAQATDGEDVTISGSWIKLSGADYPKVR